MKPSMKPRFNLSLELRLPKRALLNRLGILFDHMSPDIDETVAPGETAEGLVKRL